MPFKRKYLDLIDNEPDHIDEDLKQINLFVNDKCTVDEVWGHFVKEDIEATDISVVSHLLFAALKWRFEIFQQRPLEAIEAKSELTQLFEQVEVDKPQVFMGGVVSKRYFCELAIYLKLMYAGRLRENAEHDDKSPFEVVEEDIPVLAFDRAEEFSNQRLPTLPFACQIVNSSSAKAWTTALKKLNHAEINELRGDIGNAIDWNKLNDTFLVDFKGSMFWLPRNSIQAAEDNTQTESNTSQAETGGSLTIEGRSKTPSRSRQESLPLGTLHRLSSSNGSQSTKSSIPGLPVSPPPSVNINQLRQRFRENMNETSAPQRKRVQSMGHRSYHSVGVPSTNEDERQPEGSEGVFATRLYHVIKGAPPTDNEEVNEPKYTPKRHNRAHSDRRLFTTSRSPYSYNQSKYKPEKILISVTDDVGKLTAFFSDYDVSAKDIMSICGERIEAHSWNQTHNQAKIIINHQAIWLPSDLAYRVYDSEEIANLEPPLPRRSASYHREEKSSSVIGIRQLRNSDDGNVSLISSHLSPYSSLISGMTQQSSSPPSILVNVEKRVRSKSKSPKKTHFSSVNQVIPSPGFYYISKNRNLIFKKCTIHRLDSRRLHNLMGRRVEITHINPNLCGAFVHKDRTYLIPMSCLTIHHPNANHSPD